MQVVQIDERASGKISNLGLICALLVVVLHVGIGPAWIGKALAIKSIAVPTFFVMAGYLFAGRMDGRGWWLRQVKSRLRSLAVPYVFWNVAQWGFVAGLSVALGAAGVKYGGLELIQEKMGANWDVLGLRPLACPALGLLWFVRCLIVITVVSPLFLVFRRKLWGVAILVGYIALAIWGESLSGLGDNWVVAFQVRGWISSVIFFGAGVWLRFNGGAEVRIPHWGGWSVFAIGYACLAVGGRWTVPGLPLAMAGLWYSLDGIRTWPKMLTSCSFPIYVLHAFMGVVSSAGLAVFGLKGWAEGSALAWAMKWGVMAGGSILTAMLLRRFFPRFSVMVFGGR